MVLPWRTIKGVEPGAVKAASPVLNGGDEETCMLQRALSLPNYLAVRRASGVEACGNTSGIQVLDEPLERSAIDPSMT